MTQKTYHYHWNIPLQSSPAALWPFVADTNRFNRDTGLPPVERISIQNGASTMRFRLPIIHIEWKENPFDWSAPYRFGIVRKYTKGPLSEMRVRCELTPSGTGTRLEYEVWASPANWLGHIFIPIGIGLVSALNFARVFRYYDTLAAAGKTDLDAPGAVRLATGARQRLDAAQIRLQNLGFEQKTAQRLIDLLTNSDDLSLTRIRPYALADYWQTPRRTILELFLQATRLGILDIRWELICPMCRGAAESVGNLSEVHAEAHCASCQMDFEANFDRQVEITFRPNHTIRILPPDLEFCVGSPHRESHISITETIPATSSMSLGTILHTGKYTLETELGAVELNVSPDGPNNISIDTGQYPIETLQAGPTPIFHINNATAQALNIGIMEAGWDGQAATAADVTSLQIFRDLFASEALRAGEELKVGSVTLMFTDLRDSTRMYRQIGDAPAFGRVREHFELLEQAIAEEGGAVVKTMGDAVMAVFKQPVSALRAITKAHTEISRTQGTPQLHLKVGIHTGACIAVTLNDRLDYFGSTVNAAARLPGLADGGEIILTDESHQDPEVIHWISQTTLQTQSFQTTVKGFDHPFDLWRVRL